MRVLGKRNDGYHDIATLMQAISLGDTISFELAENDQIMCDNLTIPTDEKNLILKTAVLFRQKTGLKFGLKVHLEKQTPIEAGLGGGSSNAATTFWAINHLLNKPARLDDLINWSGEIGSDITFFLSQGLALCTGRGEKIQPLDPFLHYPEQLWVIKPDEGLSTPKVFQQFKLEQCSALKPDELCDHFQQGNFRCINDLEQAAALILPKINAITNNLKKQGFENIVMTGSGSAIYCFGKTQPEPIEGTKIFSARFIYRQPNHWYFR